LIAAKQLPGQFSHFLNSDDQESLKFPSKETVPEFFRVPEKIPGL
jgi:hypothetical protein